MSRLQADALILFAAMIWGLAFVGQATAMAHVGPLTFIGWRFAMSALFVAPLAFWESRRSAPMTPRNRGGVMVLGLIFFAATASQQAGLLSTTVTKAGFFTALYVVMVPVIGAVFLRQRPHPAIWIGVFLSLAGAVFLSIGGKFGALQWGDAIIVASALLWALQILLLGELSRHMGRPLTLAFIQSAIVAFLGIVLGLVIEAPSLPPFGSIWRELVFTGVLSGGICFTLQAIAQRYTPASDAAILMSCEALFAALGGAIFFHDRLTISGWVGCGLILLAVLLVQLAPLWRRRAI